MFFVSNRNPKMDIIAGHSFILVDFSEVYLFV
jgi:hypothetical protein